MKNKIPNKINLREELDELFDVYGYWIVIRHALPGRKCPCISIGTGEINPQCNQCLGSGRAYIDEFILARKSRPVGVAQNINAELRSAQGYQNSPDYIFYLKYNTRPTADDYILEVELDPDDQQPLIPVKITSVYDVSDVRELRSDNGRVEYYSATSERQSWPSFIVGS